jgi:hypothetical protein
VELSWRYAVDRTVSIKTLQSCNQARFFCVGTVGYVAYCSMLFDMHIDYSSNVLLAFPGCSE